MKKSAAGRRLAMGVLGASCAYLLAIQPSGRKDWHSFYRRFYYAHRGLYDNEAGIPENSMAAFRRALDHGFGMELDVQVTMDNVPVIFHDSRLERMARDEHGAKASGRIRDYSAAQLKQFHLLDTEETIPELQDVLELVGGRVPMIVELKAETKMDVDLVCCSADSLLRNYEGPYVIESFHPLVLLWYRRNHPEVIRGQLSEAYTKNRKYRRPQYFVCEHLLLNFLTKPDFIAYNIRHMNNVSRMLTRGLFRTPSVAWTIQSPQDLRSVRKRFDLYIFEGFDPKGRTD